MWIAFFAFCLVSVVSLIFATNYWRANIKYKYELTPNCLLTTSPMLFIGGRKSLLYFYNYWNFIPTFLRDHGYEVAELSLPWHKYEDRIKFLERFLEKTGAAGSGFHILGDQTSEPELKWLCQQKHPSIKSTTLITGSNNKSPAMKVSVEDLKPIDSPLQIVNLDIAKINKPSKPWFWTALVKLHNSSLFPDKGLNPQTVAIPQLTNLNSIAQEYLNLAISLAENDL